jgi:hypothetical protein
MPVPATITVLLVLSVRLRYPGAGEIVPSSEDIRADSNSGGRLPRAYLLYSAGAALVAFGFTAYAVNTVLSGGECLLIVDPIRILKA